MPLSLMMNQMKRVNMIKKTVVLHSLLTSKKVQIMSCMMIYLMKLNVKAYKIMHLKWTESSQVFEITRKRMNPFLKTKLLSC